MGSAGFGAAKGLNAGSVAAKGFGVALKTALGPISALLAGVGGITAAFRILSAQDFAEAKVETLGVNSDALRAKLKGVSAELQGQADIVELTSAAYDVASAGFASAAEASEVLSAAGKGAVGGFSDINTVADATTSVLNSYGLASDQAAKLVDGFIQTQNDGKIVIGEYAKNISKVAPVAAALKIPLEEVNAAVAQITGTGTGAEVTFTALKTAFAQLAAGGVGDKLKEFGLDISASSVAADGFVGTLEKIKASGADSGAVLKAFGTEAGPAILALLNDTEKLNRLLENQKNAQGEAAKAAFKATDTINGQVKRLQSAFTNLIAEQGIFGEAIKNALKVAAVTVEALASAFELLMVPTRAFNAIITEIGSAILSSLGTDGVETAMRLEEGFQNVRKVISQVADFAVGLARIVGQGVGAAIQNVLKVTEGLRKSLMDGFANTIGAIPRLLGNLYNSLPPFAQGLIDRVLGGAASKFREIADLGAGVMSGAEGAAGATNGIEKTGNGLGTRSLTGSGKPKETTETTTKKTDLEKQQEAAAKLLQHLERKNELDALATDEARKLKELEFAKADIAAKFPDLKQEEIKELQNLLQENYDITEEKRKQKELDDAAKKAAEELADKYKQLGDAIKDNVTNAILGAVEGTKTLGQSALDILKQIGKQALSMGINQAFGALGGAGGFLGKLFMADGGPVRAGKPYIVGERGPELFVPNSAGTIVPNEAIKANDAPSLGKEFEVKAPTFDLDLRNAFDLKLPAFDLDLRNAFDLKLPTFEPDPGKIIELDAPTFKVDNVKAIELAAPDFELDPIAPPRTQAAVSNNAMSGANVTVNVDASGSSVEGDADQAAQLGKMLGAAVQAELVRQKRPGGLLA